MSNRLKFWKSGVAGVAFLLAPSAFSAVTAAPAQPRPAGAEGAGMVHGATPAFQQHFGQPGNVPAMRVPEMGHGAQINAAASRPAAAGQFTAPARRIEMPQQVRGTQTFGGSNPPHLGQPNPDATRYYVHATDGQTYHMNGRNEMYNDQMQRVDPTKISGRMSMDPNGFRSKDGTQPAYDKDFMAAAEKFHGGTMINGMPHVYDGTSPRTNSGYNPATFYGQSGSGHNGSTTHSGSDTGASAHGAANQPIAVTSLNKYLTGTKPTLPTNGSGTATFDITNGTTVDLSVTSAYTVKNGQITFKNPAIAQAYDAASGKNSTVKVTSKDGLLVNATNSNTLLDNSVHGSQNPQLLALQAAPAGTVIKNILVTLKSTDGGPETQILTDGISLGKGQVLLPNSNYSDVTKEAKQANLPVTYTVHNGQTFTVYPAGTTPCTCTNINGTMPGGGHWGGQVDHKGNITNITINNKTINIKNDTTTNITNVTNNNLVYTTVNNIQYVTDTTTNTTVSVAEYNYAITQMQAAYLNVSRGHGGNGFFTVPSITIGSDAGTPGSGAVPTALAGATPDAGTPVAAAAAAAALTAGGSGVGARTPIRASVLTATPALKEKCTPCAIKHAIIDAGNTAHGDALVAHTDAGAIAQAIATQALQQHKDFMDAQAAQQRQIEAAQRHADAAQKAQDDAKQKLIAETIKNGRKLETITKLLGLITVFTGLTAAGVWFRRRLAGPALPPPIVPTGSGPGPVVPPVPGPGAAPRSASVPPAPGLGPRPVGVGGAPLLSPASRLPGDKDGPRVPVGSRPAAAPAAAPEQTGPFAEPGDRPAVAVPAAAPDQGGHHSAGDVAANVAAGLIVLGGLAGTVHADAKTVANPTALTEPATPVVPKAAVVAKAVVVPAAVQSVAVRPATVQLRKDWEATKSAVTALNKLEGRSGMKLKNGSAQLKAATDRVQAAMTKMEASTFNTFYTTNDHALAAQAAASLLNWTKKRNLTVGNAKDLGTVVELAHNYEQPALRGKVKARARIRNVALNVA